MTHDATVGEVPAAVADETVRRALLAVMPDADVDATEVCFDVMRAADRMQQDFEVSVHRPAGMTWAAFRNLFALLTLGPQTPYRLAQLHSVSQASTSSIIKTLSKHGLITRQPSPRDGRSVTISLTEEGRELCLELYRRNNARETAWAEALTPQEQATLVELLRKLRRHDIGKAPSDSNRLV